MHELSIAQSMIDLACEAATREGSNHVIKLRARIGLLSGVAKTALQFSFELAAEGTACEARCSRLRTSRSRVMCPRCNSVQELQTLYSFCCPTCGTPTPEILTGRELEVTSMELADDDAPGT